MTQIAMLWITMTLVIHALVSPGVDTRPTPAFAAPGVETRPTPAHRLLRKQVAMALDEYSPFDDPANSPEYGDDIEGDILGDLEEFLADEPGPLNAMTRRGKRWRGGVVPYVIGPGYNIQQRHKIHRALRNFEHRTRVNGKYCVRFPERSEEHEDWIFINKGTGCSSFVGRNGRGEQRLNLGSGCVGARGIIQHEFLHALGFHHEQKRADRDDYVTVDLNNVRRGREGNFRKLREGVSVDHLGTPYDYGSVMHYAAKAFAIDRSKPTIRPLAPGVGIGQRKGLSDMDVERVQIFYDCLDPADSRFFTHLAE